MFIASDPAPLREVGKRMSDVTARTILVIVRGRSYRKGRMNVKRATAIIAQESDMRRFDPIFRSET